MMRLVLFMFLLCSNFPRVSEKLILTLFLKKIFFLFPYASRLVTLVVVAGDNFYNLGFCFFCFWNHSGRWTTLFYHSVRRRGKGGVTPYPEITVGGKPPCIFVATLSGDGGTPHSKIIVRDEPPWMLVTLKVKWRHFIFHRHSQFESISEIIKRVKVK